jgi:deoxyguanosine kinase
MKRIISIDGNIGSGKSSIIKYFKKYYEDNSSDFNQKICFLQEPVDIWNTITDLEGKTMIEIFYSDPNNYAFAFQMMAYISRLSTIKNALKENYDIIITERCVNTDRNVFAKMLYDDGKINEIEFKIYNKWFDEFIEDFPEIEYIYLKTDPQIAFDRIIKRGRLGENIPIEYLTRCHEYHENWLVNKQKCILDCNIDIEENPEIVSEWIETINKYIKQYTITFSGVTRNNLDNSGISGAGFSIWDNNIKIYGGSEFISRNNTRIYAEYYALFTALKKCEELNIKNVIIKSSSDAIIHILESGDFVHNKQDLYPLYETILKKLETFMRYQLIQIPYEKNIDANNLAEQAITSYIVTNNGIVYNN